MGFQESTEEIVTSEATLCLDRRDGEEMQKTLWSPEVG